jgi:ubiquinone/menaquinone biosynthesis C-methylase UbiE
MDISFSDVLRLIFSVYSIAPRLPTAKKRVALFVRPLDATRYVEFAYLYKFLRKNKTWQRQIDCGRADQNAGKKILDVSSPHMMAYVLSKKNDVVKTNIDAGEKKFIKESKNLHFKIEDATRLSFSDNTFDLVYSVSVIEHIYEKYIESIHEMVRVTKSGGYIYITFPVAKNYMEEWLHGEVYANQPAVGGKTFFQYRFDAAHVEDILRALPAEAVTILRNDIFWERDAGSYEKMIGKMRTEIKNKYANYIKDLAVNAWYGLTMFPRHPARDFSDAKSFGNMHLILQKK